jgi:PhnB protein
MGSIQDQFWGDRCGTFKEPEGHTWTIATRKEDPAKQSLRRRAVLKGCATSNFATWL